MIPGAFSATGGAGEVAAAVPPPLAPAAWQKAIDAWANSPAWSRRANLMCLVVVVVAAWLSMGSFVHFCTLQQVLMAGVSVYSDMPYVLEGYHKAPNLWHDGLRWWTGSWLETNDGAFRPLAAYGLWIECAIGLRYAAGWLLLDWLAFVIFVLLCVATGQLSRQVSGSAACGLAAAVLAAFMPPFMTDNMPSYFLAWPEFHGDLVALLLMTWGVVYFDRWLKTANTANARAAYCCFVVAWFTKEITWIAPWLCACLLLQQNSRLMVRRASALRPIAVLLATTIALCIYRTHVLGALGKYPRIAALPMLKKFLYYNVKPFAEFLIDGDYWIVGLGLVMGGLLLAAIVAEPKWRGAARPRFYALLVACPLLVWFYLSVANPPAAQSLEMMLGPGTGLPQALVGMIGLILSWSLAIAYRRVSALPALWLMLVVVYIPAYGMPPFFHYLMDGWIVRSCLWPLTGLMAWRYFYEAHGGSAAPRLAD